MLQLRRASALVVCSALPLALAACSSPTSPSPQAKPGSAEGTQASTSPEAIPATDVEPTTEPPAPVDSSPGAGGRAWVDVARVGVFAIDDQGWQFVATSRAPIRDIGVVGGQLHLLNSFGIHRSSSLTDMTTLAAIARPEYEKLGEPLAMAGDGARFWVVGPRGVGRFDRTWTFTPASELDPAVTPGSEAVAVDADGRAWLAWAGLHRSEAEGWARVELPQARGRGAVAVVASRDRAVVLVHAGCGPVPGEDQDRCALVRMRGEEATTYEFPVDPGVELGSLALSSDGTEAAVAGAWGLARLDLEQPDQPARVVTHAGSAAAGAWVGVAPDSLAIDDGGRVWAGIGQVLVVVDPAGEIQRYPLAKLNDMSGTIDGVRVDGAGPPPPSLGQERRGGLRATVVREHKGGAPVVGAKVELCSHATALDASGSRCAPEAVLATLTTDDAGEIEAPDLPLDAYSISVDLGDHWAIAHAQPSTMRVGMTGNIGKVVVEPKP